MDYTQDTLREIYLKAPGSKAIAGAVEYGDYREVDGILISFKYTVYGFDIKKKNLHQLIISDFQFDKNIVSGDDYKNYGINFRLLKWDTNLKKK